MPGKFYWNTKGLNRLYSALLAMDKNIERVQAIAEGCPVSLSSKEPTNKKKG